MGSPSHSDISIDVVPTKISMRMHIRMYTTVICCTAVHSRNVIMSHLCVTIVVVLREGFSLLPVHFSGL